MSGGVDGWRSPDRVRFSDRGYRSGSIRHVPAVRPCCGRAGRNRDHGVVADAAGRRAVAVTFAGEVLAVEVDQLGGGQRVGSTGQPVTALQVIDDGTIAAAGVGHVTLVDVATGEHTVTGGSATP